jgi:hypothetical protein
VDQDTAAIFTSAFFYHLLYEHRDADFACSEKEAVERAAALDVPAKEGAHSFRYWSR